MHNVYGSRLIEADSERICAEEQPYVMDKGRREAVLTSVLGRCSQREWELLAAHVRTNHVHTVVMAEIRPERIMNDLKSYASRSLNKMGLDGPARKRWARHGSTRWLWKRENIAEAIRYCAFNSLRSRDQRERSWGDFRTKALRRAEWRVHRRSRSLRCRCRACP
ncbi:MAG: transposase [Bryobacteraceae bacterium]